MASCVAEFVAMLSSSKIPVTVAPVANAKLVLDFNAPVTSNASATVTLVESSKLIVVPLIFTESIVTAPVPEPLNCKFAFELDALISLSFIVTSATLTPPVPLPWIVTAPFVTVLVNVVRLFVIGLLRIHQRL